MFRLLLGKKRVALLATVMMGLISAAAFGIVYRQRWLDERVGKYTRVEILSTAKAKLNTLLIANEDVQISTKEMGFISLEGQPRAFWVVDATTKEGNLLASLVYDASDGKLSSVNMDIHDTSVGSDGPIERETAVIVAREWHESGCRLIRLIAALQNG